jgi:hypothetical protein
VKTGCILAEFSKEGYCSKRAAFSIIIIITASNCVSYRPIALKVTAVKQSRTAAASTKPLQLASNAAQSESIVFSCSIRH